MSITSNPDIIITIIKTAQQIHIGMKIKSAAGHKLAFYNPAGSHGGAPTSTSVYCSTHHEYYGNLIIYNSTLYTLLQENLLFLDLFAMKTPSSAPSVCLKCLTKSLLSAY